MSTPPIVPWWDHCAVRHNVPMPGEPYRLERCHLSASPEETAAIVAALERFMRATAPPPSPPPDTPPDPWQRTAILEGVSREPRADAPSPWLPTPG